jgi:2-(3-amino-3-carboxypropyl)histidine synthase
LSSINLKIAHGMEADRDVANLAPEVAPVALNGESETAPKTPKRRFIGRRAADVRAAAQAEATSESIVTSTASLSIEDSGAIQGAL